MNKFEQVDPKLIKLHPTFVKAFKIDQQTLANLVSSMESRGFDTDFPLIIWKEMGCLIDGHSRREASIQAGIIRVPVILKSFKNEADVLDFIKRTQMHRRNLTTEDKYRLLVADEGLNLAKNKKKYIANMLQCSDATAGRYLSNMADEVKLARIIGKKAAKKAPKRAKKAPVDPLDKVINKLLTIFGWDKTQITPEIRAKIADFCSKIEKTA